MQEKPKPPMKVLAIETSGSTFSLALSENGILVSEVFWNAGLTHSERLIPALKRLLSDADWKPEDLSTIAVTTGPGSFTGIRVGLSCAKTLAQGLRLPIVGIDTLELLSAAVPRGDHFVYPIIDALRDEIFVRNRAGEVMIVPVAAVRNELKTRRGKVLFIGNAAIKYHDALFKMFKKLAVFANNNLNYPRAGVLALLAEERKGNTYTAVVPLYVRRSWAEEKR